MNLKKLLSVIGVFLLTLITAVSCVKDTDYELPDLKESVPTFDGKVVDFEKIISVATAEVTEYTANEAFEGYVVSSDEGGNFYKKIYLQNETKNKAVAIAIDKSGLYSEFPLGTKVQVRLKGLTTQINNGILEVGYQVHTASGGRKSVGNMPEVIYKKHVYNLQEDPKPQSELLQETTTLQAIKNDAKLGQLITLKNVSFSKTDVGKKFHVKENDRFQGTDYTLRDAQGGTIKFRTSRYAKFINETVPAGKLDITGILTKFGSNYQFLINTLNDIKVVGSSDDNGDDSGNDQATLKTTQEIRALYSNADVTISENWKIKVVITSDKEARNINERNAYAQDQTAGIALRFDVAHGFAVGDEVEVLLKDLKLSKFNNLLQIGGITQDKAKKTGTKTLTSQTITLEQALSGNFESQLVTISDVQFKNKDAKYKDANGNQLLTNCTQELTLYTAKNAVFADTPVSNKRGSVTGNLSVFKTTIQLIIRNVSDVNFTADYANCSGNNDGGGNSGGGNSETQGGVFFSEYIEGSSNNKYLEIYNGTDKEIDLSEYSIKLYTNGESNVKNTMVLNTTGIQKLPVGGVLIIKNGRANLTLPNGVTAYANDVCNYNGDDALELIHENTVIDVIGKVGQKPNGGWEVAGVTKATADKTLRRKANVKKGNTDWDNAAANEWEVLNRDVVDGLGKR